MKDSMGRVLSMKPSTEAQKTTGTMLDLLTITRENVDALKNPPFQRPLRVNEKVREIANEIERNGVIPGCIVIGVVGGTRYLLDGQHRREAFKLSAAREALVDARICFFDSMAEAGEEFVRINSRLISLRPDDILRGLEQSNQGLLYVRKACPFVGYDMIRRGPNSPVVSMSALVRNWFGSAAEVPIALGAAARLAQRLTLEEARVLAAFATLAFEAWGRDPKSGSLWASLNLSLCMWLYRRTVLREKSSAATRSATLTAAQFTNCLRSAAAERTYFDWLVGRRLAERDRAAGYQRLKGVFAKRIEHDTGKKPMLPGPAWAIGR